MVLFHAVYSLTLESDVLTESNTVFCKTLLHNVENIWRTIGAFMSYLIYLIEMDL